MTTSTSSCSSSSATTAEPFTGLSSKSTSANFSPSPLNGQPDSVTVTSTLLMRVAGIPLGCGVIVLSVTSLVVVGAGGASVVAVVVVIVVVVEEIVFRLVVVVGFTLVLIVHGLLLIILVTEKCRIA